MPYIGTCFRFYTQMRVEKKKHLHIEFIVTSHNSDEEDCYNFCGLLRKAELYIQVCSLIESFLKHDVHTYS